jgi:hypothetical protein
VTSRAGEEESALAVARTALRAAWRTRAATRDDHQLAELIRRPARSHAAGSVRAAARSTRGALFVLRQLARVPGAGWRDTCLYRAIAECLVLRAFEFPAVVRLGVRGSADETVAAHAWTECEGIECITSVDDADDRYVPLQ